MQRWFTGLLAGASKCYKLMLIFTAMMLVILVSLASPFSAHAVRTVYISWAATAGDTSDEVFDSWDAGGRHTVFTHEMVTGSWQGSTTILILDNGQRRILTSQSYGDYYQFRKYVHYRYCPEPLLKTTIVDERSFQLLDFAPHIYVYFSYPGYGNIEISSTSLETYTWNRTPFWISCDKPDIPDESDFYRNQYEIDFPIRTVFPHFKVNDALGKTLVLRWNDTVSHPYLSHVTVRWEATVFIQDEDCPVANAGTDLIINENSQFTLDGSGSFLCEASLGVFEWRQISGPPADEANVVDLDMRETYIAPEVDGDTNLDFEFNINHNFQADSDTVRVKVLDTNPINRPPELIFNIHDTELTVGLVNILPISATDPDGDPVTLTVNPLPENAVLQPGQPGEWVLLWTPRQEDLGVRPLVFTASDGSLSDIEQIDFLVKPEEIIFLKPEEGQIFRTHEGHPVSFYVKAISPGHGILLYKEEGPGLLWDSWEYKNPSEGVFFWIPFQGFTDGAEVRRQEVVFMAVDADEFLDCARSSDYDTCLENWSSRLNVSIDITPNQFPYFTPASASPVVKTAGHKISFNVRAKDDDEEDNVIITCDTLPGRYCIGNDLSTRGNPAERTFVWDTTEDDIGLKIIEFTATDAIDLTETESRLLPYQEQEIHEASTKELIEIRLHPEEDIQFYEPAPTFRQKDTGPLEPVIFYISAIAPVNVKNIEIAAYSETISSGDYMFRQVEQGNPARTLFSWKPRSGDTGTHTVTFTAAAQTPGDFSITPAAISVTINVNSHGLFMDSDGDGIGDSIDTEKNSSSEEFADMETGGSTSGKIVNRGDQSLTLSDLPGTEGVSIKSASDGGEIPATILAFGDHLKFNMGNDTHVILTRNGSTLQVLSGSVDILFAYGGDSVATLNLPSMNHLTFDPNTTRIFSSSTNTQSVSVFFEEQTISLGPGEAKPLLIRDGDINGDGFLTVSDAILILRLLGGEEQPGLIDIKHDRNSDGKIGLEDMIYLLQEISWLR